MADTYACASCGLPVDGPSQVIEGKLYHPRCAGNHEVTKLPFKCPVCAGRGEIEHPTKTDRVREPVKISVFAGYGMFTTKDVAVTVECPAGCIGGRLPCEPVPVRATVGYFVGGRILKAGDDYKLRFDDIREGS